MQGKSEAGGKEGKLLYWFNTVPCSMPRQSEREKKEGRVVDLGGILGRWVERRSSEENNTRSTSFWLKRREEKEKAVRRQRSSTHTPHCWKNSSQLHLRPPADTWRRAGPGRLPGVV